MRQGISRTDSHGTVVVFKSIKDAAFSVSTDQGTYDKLSHLLRKGGGEAQFLGYQWARAGEPVGNKMEIIDIMEESECRAYVGRKVSKEFKNGFFTGVGARVGVCVRV